MFIKRFFPKSLPDLDWIQIEVSSSCNARCCYCPHTEYWKNWQNRHLPLPVFERLVPAFSRTKLIYLQGWGEPFMHPDFFDMLRSVKKAGCMAGTTTNATVLNKPVIEKLVAEGLDIIGFSLAGIDEKNDSIRKGTSIKKTLECMELFHRAKSKYGLDRPKIHVAYMLLRSGLDDIDKIPSFLGNTGADQTVISSLSLAVNQAMEEEARLFLDPNDHSVLNRRLLQAKNQSARLGIEVHFHITAPKSVEFRCSENVGRAFVLGSDGSVSPCVFTQMPIRGKNAYYFDGKRRFQQNLRFGGIETEPLNVIWNRKEYQTFIRDHTLNKTPAVCRYCCKGRSVDVLNNPG
jgi:MoaA/NifB/PqqE/SkfB family radical SAM enzyme